jgi:hypothetical protein
LCFEARTTCKNRLFLSLFPWFTPDKEQADLNCFQAIMGLSVTFNQTMRREDRQAMAVNARSAASRLNYLGVSLKRVS